MSNQTKGIGETQFRSLQIEPKTVVDKEKRTVRLSFATDNVVDMPFYKESLSHKPGAMVQSVRQQNMPLLYNHNREDLIGKVESIEQDAHKSYATVRFIKNARGDEIIDLINDGMLTNVSTRYAVYKRHTDQDGVMVADSWEPLEISIVTIPADPSVGINRQFLNDEPLKGDKHMAGQVDPNVNNTTATQVATPQATSQQPQIASRSLEPQVQVQSLDPDSIRKAELERIRGIQTLCRSFNLPEKDGEKFINEGWDLDKVNRAVLESLKTRGYAPAADPQRDPSENARIGLSQKEQKQYSFTRAIRSVVESRSMEIAPYEREISDALCKKLNRSTNGILIPTDLTIFSKRDYTAGSAEDGGNTIATQLLASSFIEALRNASAVMNRGATILSGLRDNVEIPRQSGVSTAQWIGETGTVTRTNATFEKVALSPKTIAAKSLISRKLLMQSSLDIEAFVRNELVTTLALGIDAAALYGTGENNEPIGLANQADVLSVTLGDDGGAPTFDMLIDMETAIAAANADVAAMSYLANAKTIGALKKLKDSNGDYIWSPIAPGFRQGAVGEVNGYPVARSNQVRSDLEKGESTGLSEMYFGNWKDLLIGEWGALEILPNPYSADAYDTGSVEIRVLQSMDVAIRHPESFCICSDISIA